MNAHFECNYSDWAKAEPQLSFAVLMSIHCFSTHNFVAIAMSCIPLKIIAIYATCILVSLKMLSRQGTMETQFDVQGKKQGKASEIEEARQGV